MVHCVGTYHSLLPLISEEIRFTNNYRLKAIINTNSGLEANYRQFVVQYELLS